MNRHDVINSVNLNAGTDFGYLVLDVINENSYPRNPGFRVMHWHEDLQFTYVLSGNAVVRTLDEAVNLNAGEGVFINKNVIHMVSQAGDCHYNSFVFPDSFLKFYPGGPAENAVTSISGNPQLNIYPIRSESEWEQEALSHLEKLSFLHQNQTKLYAYEVLVTLCSLWLVLAQNLRLPAKDTDNAAPERMREFLSYIEANYGQPISLAQLAASAHVSKSECLRCFKISMQTTPYRYLMDFRLSKAAELLRSGSEPIQNIADMVGFHQVSHFGKCFKEKTGYSPKEYRKEITISNC